jgi:hypothetical protein
MYPGPDLQIWAREAPSGPYASAARRRHAQSPARACRWWPKRYGATRTVGSSYDQRSVAVVFLRPRGEAGNPSRLWIPPGLASGASPATRTGRGEAVHQGELDEVRVGQKGCRATDLHDGYKGGSFSAPGGRLIGYPKTDKGHG